VIKKGYVSFELKVTQHSRYIGKASILPEAEIFKTSLPVAEYSRK